MANCITMNENGYELITADGRKFTCTRLYEKKTEKWHVVIPKEARDICGRTFISENRFNDSDTYEFETKTEHREGLSSGGWKSRMTEEEKAEYEACEARMEAIKKAVLSRPIRELTKAEKIEAQIAKLEALRAKLLATETEG